MKKTKKFIKNNLKTIILVTITTLLFILLSYAVSSNKTNYIDALIHSYLIDIRNNNLTSILLFITNLGGATFLIILSTILFIIIKKKKIPLYIFMNLTCAFLTNEITKSIFTRSRPIGINLIDETGFSYPSGHSMVSLSFYGFITYLLLKNCKNNLIKTIIIISSIILISLVGFSRIYLGVHYLSDVIGGFLLATIYLNLYINIIKLEKKW